MDEYELLEEIRRAAAAVPWDWARADAGWQLRVLREERRLSQRQLAHHAKMAQSEISRMERGGDACLSAWKRLYAALGWEVVLLPTVECEEMEDVHMEERDRRDRRRHEGLCTGRRRW